MIGQQAFFSAKSISRSTIGGRKAQTLLVAARHNLREIQAELGSSSNIHPERISRNRTLEGPDRAILVMARAVKIARDQGVDLSKLRKDYCQAIELVFGVSASAPVDHDAFFLRCLCWAKNAYQLPVLLAVIHHDEEHPHMHVLMAPLKDGCYVGGEPIRKPVQAKRRRQFEEEVAVPEGFQRAAPRFYGRLKTLAAKAVLQALQDLDPEAAHKLLWSVATDAIQKEPTRLFRLLDLGDHHIQLQDPSRSTTKNAGPRRTLSCVRV